MIDKLGLDGLGGASVRVEPVVVGLEPVHWYLENEDEYMSEKLRKEHERLNSYTFKLCKVAHPLYSAADVAKLQAENEELQISKRNAELRAARVDDLIREAKSDDTRAALSMLVKSEQLQAENEALRKDAERWRFFRIADWADWNAVFRVDHDGLSLPELLDKATDAAMKG